MDLFQNKTLQSPHHFLLPSDNHRYEQGFASHYNHNLKYPISRTHEMKYENYKKTKELILI